MTQKGAISVIFKSDKGLIPRVYKKLVPIDNHEILQQKKCAKYRRGVLQKRKLSELLNTRRDVQTL